MWWQHILFRTPLWHTEKVTSRSIIGALSPIKLSGDGPRLRASCRSLGLCARRKLAAKWTTMMWYGRWMQTRRETEVHVSTTTFRHVAVCASISSSHRWQQVTTTTTSSSSSSSSDSGQCRPAAAVGSVDGAPACRRLWVFPRCFCTVVRRCKNSCFFVTSLHFAWVVDDAKCILVTRVCVCVSVCLSLAAFPHYCTDPDETWGNGRQCP